MEKELINRVAKSGIRTLSLGDFRPEGPVRKLDLKEYLFKGLVLREKEFRAHMKEMDWEGFRDAHLVVFCSTDAIIPMWAYMLVASYASGIARSVYIGSKAQFLSDHMCKRLDREIDPGAYRDAMVVIKGCGDFEVPPAAFARATEKLIPVVKSLMYGEPCSTVPIYKKKKTASQRN